MSQQWMDTAKLFGFRLIDAVPDPEGAGVQDQGPSVISAKVGALVDPGAGFPGGIPPTGTFTGGGGVLIQCVDSNGVPAACPPFTVNGSVAPQSVPGPLPLAGAATAFAYSRRLRNRIKGRKPPVRSALD